MELTIDHLGNRFREHWALRQHSTQTRSIL
jgi:hypothetical protein